MADTALQPLETRARRIDGQQFYIATIAQPSSGLTFRAFVPETFNLQIQNHWEPIFGDQGSTTPIKRVAAAVGSPINVKYLSRLIWQGTEPLDFSLTFHLDAYSSTSKDVEEPIINLLKMSTPKRSGIFLKSPGPTLISDENRIYLRIGRFFVVDSVVIKNIDITFYTVADKIDGRYMSADLNVSMSTAYTPDQDDILNYFKNGQSNNNDLSDSNKVPEAVRKLGEEVQKTIDTTKQEAQGIQDFGTSMFNKYLGR